MKSVKRKNSLRGFNDKRAQTFLNFIWMLIKGKNGIRVLGTLFVTHSAALHLPRSSLFTLLKTLNFSLTIPVSRAKSLFTSLSHYDLAFLKTLSSDLNPKGTKLIHLIFPPNSLLPEHNRFVSLSKL